MKNTLLLFVSIVIVISHALAQSVTVSGRKIMVNNAVYQIRGVCYSPHAAGSPEWIVDFSQIDKDIQLMKDACINTIRIYRTILGKAELDKFAAADIKVIVGFTLQETQNGTYANYINTYKNHPAILMWVHGNEFNYHPDWFGNNINTWYSQLNTAAGNTKNLDQNHPVATVHGELPSKAIIDACPNVQIWGLNIYRGDNHGPLYSDWASRSSKPMFIAESGADSYPDNQAPVKAIPLIWNNVYSNITTPTTGTCAGICFFSWTDEWWKSGNNSTQDIAGFANGGVPYDGFANEEYWGVLDVTHKPKPAYNTLKTVFCKDLRPAPSTNIITIYADCNMSGFSAGLTTGNYTLSQLKTLGVYDNDISSLKVPEGYKVILFNNDNFTGTSKEITQNTSCLVDQNFNDLTTSIQVKTNGLTNQSGNYFIQNKNSNLYFDISGALSADGTNAIQSDYNGNANQQFELTHLGDGNYKIIAKHSSKSIDIKEISTKAGAELHQWTYNATNKNQHFIIVDAGNGFVKLIPEHSALVLQTTTKNKGEIIHQANNNGQVGSYWKLKSTAVTGTAHLHHTETLQIQPNPFINVIVVDGLNKATIYNVKIVNMYGEEILQTTLSENHIINTSSLTKGVYFIIIENQNTIHSQKIIKY